MITASLQLYFIFKIFFRYRGPGSAGPIDPRWYDDDYAGTPPPSKLGW